MLLSAETRLGLRMTGIVACDSITVAIQKKIKIKKFSTLLCWPGEDDILPSRSERKKTVTSQRAPLPRPFGELLQVPEATRGHKRAPQFPPILPERPGTSNCGQFLSCPCEGKLSWQQAHARYRWIPCHVSRCQNDPGRSDIGAYYSIAP